MKKLQGRNITFETGQTKICIPVMGKNIEEVTAQVQAVRAMQPDLVEWRADDYQIQNTADIGAGLKALHAVLGEIPILFTFRTQEEGGNRQVDFETYADYCRAAAAVAEQCQVAAVDVEVYGKKDETGLAALIEDLHAQGVLVIGSNHHFDATPAEETMVQILKTMKEQGADICKLAVMPQEKTDVDRLIAASEAAEETVSALIVTMSMGELGAVTRVCPRLTQTVMTFAAGVGASAPGQPEISVVRELLKVDKGCSLEGNIALIGFMGTGKTTISKALARITGFEEIDVDQYIVEQAGMEIKDIFAQYGETHFRDLETKALQELQSKSGLIISCGGGAVLRDENVQILKTGSVIVLLTATPETIFERVKDHTHRPILNNDMSIGHVTELMNQREPRYQSVADIKISVDRSDRVVASYEIITKLAALGRLKFSS